MGYFWFNQGTAPTLLQSNPETCKVGRMIDFLSDGNAAAIAALAIVGLMFVAIPRYRVPYHVFMFTLAAAPVAEIRRRQEA